MNRGRNYFIRFDADEMVGMGHFTRCLAVGRQLAEEGEKVVFVSKRISGSLQEILSRENQQYLRIPGDLNWNQEADFLKKNFDLESSVFILDIATSCAFEDLKGVSDFLNELKQNAALILLDGMGDNALFPKIEAPLDAVIVPYFGADELYPVSKNLQYFTREKRGIIPRCSITLDIANLMKRGVMPKSRNDAVYFLGPEYYVFAPEYRKNGRPQREIRKTADSVLVTLGGADPLGVTLKVLKALFSIHDMKLDVRVVIGSNFNAALREDILTLAASFSHPCSVIDRPESLLEHMLWSDIAITSSGLTKYELAVTGTPALQISFSEDHARVNDFFVRHGSIKHLGVNSNVTIDYFSGEIRNLLGDYDGRKRMSLQGQALLDTQGVNRIIEAMRSLACEK